MPLPIESSPVCASPVPAAGATRRALVALSAVAALMLAGCAEQTNSSSAEGDGVAVGASMEQYQAALADMEPVVLDMQSTAPQGAQTGRRFEEYAAAVEEWSGGKIRFEIAYANAIAPPAEAPEAVRDGRLDIASVITVFAPAEYPANNALWDLSFLGSQAPVGGILQWHGAMLDVATDTQEIYDEFEEKGLVPLLPMFTSGSMGVACAEPRRTLDRLEGSQVASQSQVQNTQAQALGMSPVSVTYAEMFESLQRGVVDCTFSSLTIAALVGFVPVAPHFAIDQDHGFGNPGGAIVVSKQTYEELPLAARQLLFDRVDVMLEATMDSTWANVADAVKQLAAAGGGVSELGPDASRVLEQVNEQVLQKTASNPALEDGQAVVDEARAAHGRWADIVDELELETGVSYDDMPDWYASADRDLSPFMDRLWEEVMADRRPE